MAIFSIGTNDVDKLVAYIKDHTDDELREELLPDGALPESLEDHERAMYPIVIMKLKEFERSELAEELFKATAPQGSARTIEEVEAELEEARAQGDEERIRELEAEYAWLKSGVAPGTAEEAAKEQGNDPSIDAALKFVPGLPDYPKAALAAKITAELKIAQQPAYALATEAHALYLESIRKPSGVAFCDIEFDKPLDEDAIPGLAWMGTSSILVAPPKWGKTTLLAQALVAMFEKDPNNDKWCGFELPKHRHILYVSEQQLERTGKWMLDAAQDPEKLKETLGKYLRFLDHKEMSLTLIEKEINKLKEDKKIGWMKAPDVVIVDTFSRSMTASFPAAKENDANDTSRYLNALREIIGPEASLLMLHHANKARGQMRGSTAILAHVDMQVRMCDEDGEAKEGKSTETTRKLEYQGRWSIDDKMLKFTKEPGGDGAGVYSEYGSAERKKDAQEKEETKEKKRTAEIVAVLREHGECSTTTILEKLKEQGNGVAKAYLVQVLTWRTGKEWKMVSGPHGSKLYSLIDSSMLV